MEGGLTYQFLKKRSHAPQADNAVSAALIVILENQEISSATVMFVMCLHLLLFLS